MIPPLPSTITATIYIFFLATLSCIQFRRSRTPLRLGAAVMSVFGLSISVLSIVYTTDKLSLSIFWVYQFVAECVAVTWVITTIIHLGYAFYPVTRHQTLIWRTALGSVFLYDLVAISELCYYCYAVWGSGTLSKEGTPVLWIYWVRQMVKVIASTVTIAYLFVPLVRHHHTTGVAMIADSNTLAVGTWYLTALGVTSLGYIAMFIYYMANPKEVFSPQAQALDLCMRLTACPIFSLPPPPILLKYFHKKYGSTIRDDPDTMIEEGITNNPRPRRPPFLVSQPTSHNSRRGSVFDLDYPSYQERHNFSIHSPFSDLDEVRCKRYMDEEANIGTASSLCTATETSPKLKPISINSSLFQKGAQTPITAVGGDSVLTSVSIPIPPLDTQSTSSTHETTTPPSPPSAFAQGITLDRDEDEETAIAARQISRRFTMEGRKDGLGFLNIGGLIKWPHRPNSATPASKATLSEPSGNSTFRPLPAIVSGPSLIMSSRSRSDSNIPPSGARCDKPSQISENYIKEEDEFAEDTSWRYGHDGHAEDKVSSHGDDLAQQGRWDRTTPDSGLENHTDLSDVRTDTYHSHAQKHDYNDDPHVRSKASDTTLNEHDEGLDHRKISALRRSLSMDNIRQMSRHALTRFQERSLRTALSIPLSTGPLSPTILRTSHGNSTEESRLNSSKSSSSNSGDVVREQIPNQDQHTPTGTCALK